MLAPRPSVRRLRFTTYFAAQERRPLPVRPAVRSFLQIAAAPDVVADLLAIATELEATPHGRLDPCHLVHDKVVLARRLRRLVKLIQVVEPIAAKTGSPRLARIAPKPVRPARRVEGQLSLFGAP